MTVSSRKNKLRIFTVSCLYGNSIHKSYSYAQKYPTKTLYNANEISRPRQLQIGYMASIKPLT